MLIASVLATSACAAEDPEALDSAPDQPSESVAAAPQEPEPFGIGHSEPTPESIEAKLLTAKDGALVETIEVRVENVSDSPREVWLEVVGIGLNGQNAARTFGTTALEPAASAIVRVPVADLPMQSALYPITTIIGVAYSGSSDGDVQRMLLKDFTVCFESDLRHAALAPNGKAPAFELPAGVAQDAVGRVFDAKTRTFATLGHEALALGANATYAGPGKLSPEIAQLLRGAQPTPETTLIEKAASTKFCFKMIYAFTDGGGTDDYIRALWPQLEQTEARYTAAAIVRGSTLVWLGHLDSTGCTPSLPTPAATYQAALYSQVNRGGRMFQVRISDADPSLTPMIQNVSITAATSSTVNLVMTAPLDVLNAVVVARRVASAMPDALPIIVPSEMFPPHGEGQFTININQGCGDRSAGCYSGRKIFLGTDDEGFRIVGKKYIIAHEIGHGVQDHLFGLFNHHNYATPETPASQFCRCDHVEIHNNLHCMQGREHVSAAQVEAWAHLVAARTFNNPDEANCGFQYYKELLTLFDGVDHPPATIGCQTPVRWRDNACSMNERGVPWDWLTFYWNLTTQTSNKLSWGDVRALYRQACGGAKCTGAHSITWPMLVSAANTVFGSTSAKRNYLVSLGATHGVD